MAFIVIAFTYVLASKCSRIMTEGVAQGSRVGDTRRTIGGCS